MNILHVIHKLCAGPQETPFISEATDFTKNKSLIFISYHTIHMNCMKHCQCYIEVVRLQIQEQVQYKLFEVLIKIIGE